MAQPVKRPPLGDVPPISRGWPLRTISDTMTKLNLGPLAEAESDRAAIQLSALLELPARNDLVKRSPAKTFRQTPPSGLPPLVAGRSDR